jgi:ABC-type transporter Mla subunit MlaD
MSRRLAPIELLVVGTAVVVAAVLFLVLNHAFGGPGPGTTGSFRLSATVGDAQGLVKKSLVLVRGVDVGEVAERVGAGDRTRITLAIDAGSTPVFRDATIRPGRRTLFGEAYVQLDPGHAAAGKLASGAQLPAAQVLDSVELDEALDSLDAPARARLRSLNETGARVDADPAARGRLNATVGSLGTTLAELRRLGALLAGQREDVTRLVASSREVLDTLARRDDAVAALVSDARVTAEAAVADDAALRPGLAEAPRLLDSARTTLDAVEPLARRARPVVDALTTAAPALTRSLRRVRPVARSAGTVVRALPAFTAAATPALARLRRVARLGGPFLAALEPALRNLVPITRVIADYRRETVGFISAGTGIRELLPSGYTSYGTLARVKDMKPFEAQGENGAPYGWARFFIDATTGATLGRRSGAGTNPYPDPGDPLSHFSGHYRRLEPEPLPPIP